MPWKKWTSTWTWNWLWNFCGVLQDLHLVRLCKHSKLQRIHLPLKELDSSWAGWHPSVEVLWSFSLDPRVYFPPHVVAISTEGAVKKSIWKGICSLLLTGSENGITWFMYYRLLQYLQYIKAYTHARWEFSAGKGRDYYYKSYQIYCIAYIMLSHWLLLFTQSLLDEISRTE